MVKLVSFQRTRPPSVSGYNDPCTIFDKDSNILGIYPGRSTPNAFQPSTKAIWDACYGCIALGIYNGRFGYDAKKRLCIIINEGFEVPAILPNINNHYRHIVKSAEVHQGWREDDPSTPQNEDWPGSAACCTIKTSFWSNFCTHFVLDEFVKVEIKS